MLVNVAAYAIPG